MHQLAAAIQEHFDARVDEFNRHLQEHPDYAALPADVRKAAAGFTLNLAADWTASGNDSGLIRFIQDRASERAEQGLNMEMLQHTVNSLEAVIEPHIRDAETARFVWRTLSKAHDAIAQAATQAMRALETKLRHAQGQVERSPAGIYRTTPAGQLVEANPAFLQILGFDSPDALNRVGVPNLYENPDDRRRLIELLQRGPVTGFETRLRRADGRVIDILLSVRLVQDADGTSYLEGMAEGITERKRAGAALRESEERFRRFSEVTTEGVVFHEKGKITDVNAALTAMFGLSDASEAVGKGLLEFIAPESRESVVKQMLAGSTEPYEAVALRKDGTTFPVQAAARSYEYQGQTFRVASLHDITERKKAEAALRESEERFRSLYDNATVGLYRTTPGGRILMVNPAGVKMMGFDSFDELAQRNLEETGFEENNPRQAFLDRLERDGVIIGLESEWVKKDGSTIFVRESAKAYRDQDGCILYYDGSFEDITERKLLEQQIQESLKRRGFQVQTSTEVAQDIAAAPALDELFRRVVTLIKDRFGYYHAQIFRYEVGQDAVVLVAGYGEAGRKMLAAGHKLAIGRGVVGTAAATGKPILAADVTQDKDWQPHPNLPDTQGELAVPIKLRDEVLGILDVQSSQASALTQEDQLLLEGLCGQIAIAIDSKRTQAALAREQFLLDSMMNNVPMSIYFKDTAGHFIRVSRETARVMGLNDPAVMVGKSDFDFFSAEHAQHTYEDEQKIMRTGQPITHEERDTRPGRPDAWVWTTKLPLRDQAGNMVGTFGISTNITERKLAEAKTQETLQELERLYRATAREGWQAFRETERVTPGYVFDRTAVQAQPDLWLPQIEQAVQQNALVPPTGEQPVAAAPLAIRGEIIGAVGIYDDPQNPLSPEDLELVQQITEQGALALESARLFEQTQVALDEARVLYEAGRRVSSATNPQDMLTAVIESVRVPAIANAALWELELSITGEPEAFILTGRWHDETGVQPLPVGTRLVLYQFPATDLALATEPSFVDNVERDERLDSVTHDFFQRQQARGLGLLPLWVGNRQLGVLMLMSGQPHHFAEKEIRPYTSLARQVAIALENRRLFEQTRAALEEVEATQRRYLGQQWETYLASARDADKPLGFVDSPQGVTAESNMWLPEMEQALQLGELILAAAPDEHAQRSALAVPLKLRGLPIGVIEFYEESGQREWSDDERALVQALADQAVLALENARLFEETQGRAQREQLINQITARVRASNDMQAILRTTAEELARVLNLSRARIRLGTGDTDHSANQPDSVPSRR